MSTEDVFKKFYNSLMKTLPMEDVVFVANLYSSDLLTGEIKTLMWSQPSREAKASLFLDCVIGPSVSKGFTEKLDMLLDCMEEHEAEEHETSAIKALAKEIRSQQRIMPKPS